MVSKTGSPLPQVMTCCLMAPRHHLNQSWFIISEVLLYSIKFHFPGNAHDVYPWYEFGNCEFQITGAFPRSQWVNETWFWCKQWSLWHRPVVLMAWPPLTYQPGEFQFSHLHICCWGDLLLLVSFTLLIENLFTPGLCSALHAMAVTAELELTTQNAKHVAISLDVWFW